MILQVYRDSDGFNVWAEPEAGDKFLGLCIGVGDTYAEAVAFARHDLLDGLRQVETLRTRLEPTNMDLRDMLMAKPTTNLIEGCDCADCLARRTAQ